MADTRYADDWLTVDETLNIFHDQFRTKSALKYHLARRADNGLEARDAVRLSPLGTILVNPARFRAWLIGEIELVPLKRFSAEHSVPFDSLYKAIRKHSVPVFERLGATCIRREDAAKLLQLETRQLDGLDVA